MFLRPIKKVSGAPCERLLRELATFLSEDKIFQPTLHQNCTTLQEDPVAHRKGMRPARVVRHDEDSQKKSFFDELLNFFEIKSQRQEAKLYPKVAHIYAPQTIKN